MDTRFIYAALHISDGSGQIRYPSGGGATVYSGVVYRSNQ